LHDFLSNVVDFNVKEYLCLEVSWAVSYCDAL